MINHANSLARRISSLMTVAGLVGVVAAGCNEYRQAPLVRSVPVALLRMVRAEFADGDDIARRAARKLYGTARLSSTAAPASLPLFGQRALSEATIERIRHDFPGWDIYALQAEFDAWLADSSGRSPRDYEAAFYGFVRQHHARNSA